MVGVINKENLYTSLAFNSSQTEDLCAHLPSLRSLSKALTRFTHVHHAGVLNTTSTSQGHVLGAASGSRKGKRSSLSQEDGGGGKRPPSAQVQLSGHVSSMTFSSSYVSPFIHVPQKHLDVFCSCGVIPREFIFLWPLKMGSFLPLDVLASSLQAEWRLFFLCFNVASKICSVNPLGFPSIPAFHLQWMPLFFSLPLASLHSLVAPGWLGNFNGLRDTSYCYRFGTVSVVSPLNITVVFD